VVNRYLGCENVVDLVVEYDENLLLPLLTKTNKLLMFHRVEMSYDLHSQVDFKGLFHSTTTRHIHKHHVNGACWISMVFYWLEKLQMFVTLAVNKKTQVSNHCSCSMTYYLHPNQPNWIKEYLLHCWMFLQHFIYAI
jgi:hypothetical protein